MKIRNKFLASILTASMFTGLLSGCAGVTDLAAVDPNAVTEAESEVSDADAEQAEAEMELASQNTLAIKAMGYSGLTNLRNDNNEDGSYFYEDMTEDGLTIITNMCAPSKGPGDESVEEFVSAFVTESVKEGCTVTGAAAYDELVNEISYPVYRVDWEWGSNEDTTWGTGVVIPTDTFNYYYGYSCPADFYEDNEGFYNEELKNVELIELEESAEDASETSDVGLRASLSLGNNENTGEESDEVEAEVFEDAAEDPEAEKKPGGELVRGYDPAENTVEVKDLVGYWKYDAYDEMYLAIYDSGSYETYDMKTDDLQTEGKYELNGTQLELKEKGGDDTEILTVLGTKRLMDSEGDTLSPYVPVKPTAADASDSSDVTRRYGSYDGYYEEQSDGSYKLKSPSKGVYVKFPSWYDSGEGDDYVWASDGNNALITGRNVTDEYYSYPGTDEEFIREIGSLYLATDFYEFFGSYDGVGDATFRWGSDSTTVGTLSANIWNDWNDLSCCTKLFVSNFKDGSCEIMIINSFYNYGDNYSKENMKAMTVGGLH
ncbi:MAG: hypothetical protein K5886_12840 [Lachnospiraceae bacterium]|nr:hypothetical protein [Lachnospiraceae bacterium]